MKLRLIEVIFINEEGSEDVMMSSSINTVPKKGGAEAAREHPMKKLRIKIK